MINQLIFLSLFHVMSLNSIGIHPALDASWDRGIVQQESTPQPDPFGTPVPTPSPTPVNFSQPSVSTQIFKVVFSSETLSEAISKVLEDTSKREVEALSDETTQVSSLLGSIIQPPSSGYFSSAASSSMKTAAALAPPLFLLRLVLHHWRRLMVEDEGLIAVVGDWVAAGFIAAAAGPFLDIVVQAGWWAAGAALGETAQLAREFLSVSLVSNALRSLPVMGRPSMFFSVFAVGAGLGGLVGVMGLIFAFAVAQAVLFVLGILAPVISVIAVLPQMRWMRGLWLKAIGILALIPLAAGGIFKAAIVLAVSFGGEGMVELLIRLCWLWGAAGFLLSLAGILGKFSLSAAVETAGKFTAGVRSMVSIAMAASGNGAVGIAQMTSARGAAAATAENAAPATYAATEQLPGLQSAGLQTVNPQETTGYQSGFSALAPHFYAAGLDPNWVQENFPEETARMVDAYQRHPDQIEESSNPLVEAARLGNAQHIQDWIDPRDEAA